MKNIAVLGAGAWGTALAQIIACNNINVNLWVREPELVKDIKTKHKNNKQNLF